jgi:hypothetical protein
MRRYVASEISTLYFLLMHYLSLRRRLEALVDSVGASKLIQDICIGRVSTEDDVGKSFILFITKIKLT